MHSKCIGLRPRRFESCRCRFASFFYCYLSFGARHAFVLLSGQMERGEGAECRLSRVCGVVVSHPLRMRRVPGSNPGESILLLPLSGQIPVSDRLIAAPRQSRPHQIIMPPPGPGSATHCDSARKMSEPGFEPGLSRPQRDVLTARRFGQ